MEFLLGVVTGTVIMDFMWAWRLGLVRTVYLRVKQRIGKR